MRLRSARAHPRAVHPPAEPRSSAGRPHCRGLNEGPSVPGLSACGRARYAADMNTRSLGIALVFIAGCAVGGASARFVVPPANAQQATLTKWEYLCPAMPFNAAAEAANKAGAEGWELVNYDPKAGIGCFKRPKL